MNTISWCHCSDAHLGYKQYNLSERLKDFGEAFNKCILLIIEKNPDFVIFTGDLFEHYNPKPPELRQAIAILNKLKNKNIPIYVIAGNHDVSYSISKRYGGDILHFLQDLNLIIYLEDDINIVKKNNKPIALIAGIHYYGKKTPEKLTEFYEKYKDKFERNDIPKILMLHAFVEGSVINYDISSYKLNMYPFDYIACGHYHIKWPKDFSIKDNKIFYPGGTEHRSSFEWSHPRGFITVNAKLTEKKWDLKPEFITYDVRPKKVISKDFGFTTAEQIIKQTRNMIEQNDKDGMLLKLNLIGTIKKGEIPFINFHNLKSFAKNTLYIDITNFLTSSSLTGPNPPKTEREAYIEIFKNNFNVKKEFLDLYVSFIENIVKIGDDKNFEELTSHILNEFVIKNPEAIIYKEKIDNKQKSTKKNQETGKKGKSSKKLESYI